MKIFSLDISDQPSPRKKYRYGEMERIVYKNGYQFIGNTIALMKAGKQNIEDDLENVKKVIISLQIQKKDSEPFPNFLSIRFAFVALDDKSIAFLDQENILYKTIPVETTNASTYQYKLVFFEEKVDLVALKESNVYLSEKGFVKTNGREYFNPLESRIVLKSKALGLKGIYRLKETYMFICNEETKLKLEKSGLTGFSFKELEVAGN